MHTEWCFQQMVHLLGHLHIQPGVCTRQNDVLLGLLTLPLHGLVLAVLLLAQLQYTLHVNNGLMSV